MLQEKLITPKEAASYAAQNNRLLKTVLLPAYIALGSGGRFFLFIDKQ